jgi:hypothetical protein
MDDAGRAYGGCTPGAVLDVACLQSNRGRIFALLNVNELRAFTKHVSLTNWGIRLRIGVGPMRLNYQFH